MRKEEKGKTCYRDTRIEREREGEMERNREGTLQENKNLGISWYSFFLSFFQKLKTNT
jgi:hypothetical protein